MTSSFNWVDGSAGGTPLTAANLNKMMVAGDVGRAGTPTGDALRAAIGGYYTPEMYGAKGDGATDDAAAVQAAIDAANNSGGIAANTPGGGTVRFAAKTYLIGSTLTLYGGVHLRGAGPGGDVFSGTDANLPYRGTVLRLKSGANVDLIRTANFSTLTGTATPSAYAVPNRFGIYDLVLDGNKAGNTSGRCLVIYGRSYWLQNLVIQNAPGVGFYSEYGTSAGYDNEAQILNVRIQDNTGDGWIFKGPHDSTITNAFVARNGGSGFVTSGPVGSLAVTAMHNWGNATYNFDVGSSGQDISFVNCVCDGVGSATGVGMRVTASGVRWLGGSLYGTGAQGETLLQLGDPATAYTIGGLDFHTRWFGVGAGSTLASYAANVVLFPNVFRGAVNNGTNSRGLSGALKVKVVGAQSASSGTLTVASTAGFPTSGSLYTAAGTVSYTGTTATTFTGVSGGAAVTLDDGSWLSQSTPVSTLNETFDWRSADGNTVLNFQDGGVPGAKKVSNLDIDQVGGLLIRNRWTLNQTVSAAGALTLDAAKGNAHVIQLNANCTGSTIVNPTSNQELEITWMQDGTGGRTYAWPTNCAFVGGVAPSDTTANRRTSVRFWYDPSASKWYELSRAVSVG